MAKIGFIGLGNMGLPMAQNLIKAGHTVDAASTSAHAAVDRLRGRRRRRGDRRSTMACTGAEVVITMLPAGEQVREVYLGADGVLASAPRRRAADRLLDHRRRDRARRSRGRGRARGSRWSTRRSRAASPARRRRRSPSWSAGRDARLRARASRSSKRWARPSCMPAAPGNGQAAKICNNMILGVSMIAVSEAFVLAEKLGLDAQKLFDISSKSSGQCWSMTSYCPVPGPVPTSPANRDYQAGFTAAMMLKDLKLAQDAARRRARQHAARRRRGRASTSSSSRPATAGVDFSGIIRFLRGRLVAARKARHGLTHRRAQRDQARRYEAMSAADASRSNATR